jgi:hydroxymethylglutaryl-CoA reductase
MIGQKHGSNRTSRIAGLHRKSPQERLDLVAAFAGLDQSIVSHLSDMGNLPPALADKMIENVVGTMNVPIGIATNLKIDGEDVLVPMATEELRDWLFDVDLRNADDRAGAGRRCAGPACISYPPSGEA